MTRLKSYIREETGTEEMIVRKIDAFKKLVNKTCKPWLTATKGCPQPVAYRGMRAGMNAKNIVINKPVRQDRRPLDTAKDISEPIDKAFEEMFGWKGRSNAVFVSGEEMMATDYGRANLIFPMGSFKFIWSPIIDDFIHLKYRFKTEVHFREFLKEYPTSAVIDYLKGAEYTDKYLCAALRSGNEIMINCKQYHAISLAAVKFFMRSRFPTSTDFGRDFVKEYILK